MFFASFELFVHTKDAVVVKRLYIVFNSNFYIVFNVLLGKK